MLSATSSNSANKSPISTVPYDILIEILIHCLPKDRFEIRQPNTTIAPLLLCHICSSWRTIALTTPILWSHLSFCFTLSVSRVGLAFRKDEIDFIQWWQKHQGSNAPFLRLAIERDDDKPGPPAAHRTAFPFIMNYMRSAQHLEVDPRFWEHVPPVYPDIDTGARLSFPHLHTLVAYQYLPRARPEHYFHHTFSALRRLAIVDNNTALRDAPVPAQWAALTHLSISTFMLSLDFWLHLTAGVPRLEWAYISFTHHSPSAARTHNHNHNHPPTRTLPHLATLFISSGDNNDATASLGPLFAGLRLPALTTLLLSSVIRDWWDHTGLTDIHAVLPSAPALRTLTLRKHDALSPAEIAYAIGPTSDVPVPLWRSAPHLAHLQLDLHVARDLGAAHAAQAHERFAESGFLRENRWLALDDPACPIKRITVIDPPRDPFASDAHRALPSIRGCVGAGANKVALDVVSHPYADFADAWKEWRSGN